MRITTDDYRAATVRPRSENQNAVRAVRALALLQMTDSRVAVQPALRIIIVGSGKPLLVEIHHRATVDHLMRIVCERLGCYSCSDWHILHNGKLADHSTELMQAGLRDLSFVRLGWRQRGGGASFPKSLAKCVAEFDAGRSQVRTQSIREQQQARAEAEAQEEKRLKAEMYARARQQVKAESMLREERQREERQRVQQEQAKEERSAAWAARRAAAKEEMKKRSSPTKGVQQLSPVNRGRV